MSPRHVLMALIPGLILASVRPGMAQNDPGEPGSWRVGGSANVTESHDIGNDTRAFIIDLSPRVGYFIAPGLALDANLRLRRVSSRAGLTYGWGFGPGATYYFARSSWLMPFPSARSLFVSDHFRGSDRQFDRDLQTTAWLVGGGAVLMLASHVGVSAEFFYQFSRAEIGGTGGDGNEAERYGLQFGVAAFVF